MAWKEDIAQTRTILEANRKHLQILISQAALNTKKIEELRIIVVALAKNQSGAAERMGDRLVEMAMVQKGESPAAASHRRILKDEVEPLKPAADLWDEAQDPWPPPGCDAIRIP